MDLRERIKEILSLDKFNDLSYAEKSVVEECIFAQALILSSTNLENFLSILEKNVLSITDIKNDTFKLDDMEYSGIVLSNVGKHSTDIDGFIYPMEYQVYYRMYNTPLNRISRTALHEFGHVVVKKDFVNLYKAKPNRNGALDFDMGGLVINHDLKGSYGTAFTEVINELTTFLALKASISYRIRNLEAEKKMIEFASSRGIKVESQPDKHLDIIPDDFFENSVENSLANSENMFNETYVKYTSLVRFIMRAFQNPLYTIKDLQESFKNKEGLSAKKDGLPINDLLYGYYEDAFAPQSLFDTIMDGEIYWQDFCEEFDSKLLDKEVDIDFIESTYSIFTKFYERRNKFYLDSGKITEEEYNANLEDFYKVLESSKRKYEDYLKK